MIRILVNLILSNLTKIRVVFASILPKTSVHRQRHLQACLVRFSSKAAKQPSGIMGRVMFFLLRMAFWLGRGLCAAAKRAKSTSPDAQIDAIQAATLAGAAVSDVRGFCARSPTPATSAARLPLRLSQAEAGARTIYEFISGKMNEKPAPAEKTAKLIRPRHGVH